MILSSFVICKEDEDGLEICLIYNSSVTFLLRLIREAMIVVCVSRINLVHAYIRLHSLI